ncbi:uncharacterized protein [Arachis hypogaea]|uniref:uncharacterized protein isoform X1 n=1 Tax=Arachis hypogaea TaxID=3818 RepID=UPI003B21A890
MLSRAAVPGRRKNPLQSLKNSAGAIAGVLSPLLLEVAAGLLPNRSGNRRCSGSAVPSYLRVDVVTAKVSKAVVQAAGDFGMRRKGLCETFGLWICVLRNEERFSWDPNRVAKVQVLGEVLPKFL